MRQHGTADKRLIVLHHAMTPEIERMVERLSSGFGPDVVLPREVVPEDVTTQDVIAILIGNGTWGGFNLEQPDSMRQAGIGQALLGKYVVLPVLLGNTKMAARSRLAKDLAPLAGLQALTVRPDENLHRDLGRLVSDFELLSGRRIGEYYPFHWWVIPVGCIALAAAAIVRYYWYFEIRDWSYAYQTSHYFDSVKFWFGLFGWGLMGTACCLLMVCFGWRRRLIDGAQLGEYFRSGSGDPPARPNRWLNTGALLGIASIGWGPASAVAAAVALVVSMFRRTARALARRELGLLAIAILSALVGSLWMLGDRRLEHRLERTLDIYQQGVDANGRGKTEQAKQYWLDSIRVNPSYPHTYRQLGMLSSQAEDDSAALDYLSQAIARYPAQGQGMFGPERTGLADTYAERAKVYLRLGEEEKAKLDQERESELRPFFLSGLFDFRWW
jgi:tetratricopeptide (TPR) repeat protein